ncbi:MAG: DUF1778 domain-containing protein [Allorhizobium sp.]
MPQKPGAKTKTRAVNLRIRDDVRILIDRAATAHGKTRSNFMIDAARRAAEDALLEEALVRVDPESFAQYLVVLDQPPSGDGFVRLMNAAKPWQP